MIAAFSVWNGRIAPVFDVAQSIAIINADNGQTIEQKLEDIRKILDFERVEWLKDKSVSVLVCGAISRHLEESITNSGIKVISFISGESEKVIRAWLNNEELHSGFTMPGCMRRNQCRFRGERTVNNKRSARCRTESEG